MVHDLSSVFKSVEASGARFTRRLFTKGAVGDRINLRDSTLGFPILINAKEFSALMGWPLNGAGAKRAKRIAPTIMHDSDGIVIGTPNSPKQQSLRVAIPESGLTVHTSEMSRFSKDACPRKSTNNGIARHRSSFFVAAVPISQ
jgi:hypothetical protein